MNPPYGQRRNWRALGGVAALHGVAVLMLMNMEPAARVADMPQPLMVSLLSAAAPEPPGARQPPAQVQPLHTSPIQLPPALAARAETPAPSPAPLPEPVPAPAAPPAPAPVPAPAPAKPAAMAEVAPPAPVIPPSFDADYLDNPAPAYPALSRRLGEQGQVLLRVLVSADGHAAEVEIHESSGRQRLDRAARDTVLRWRFAPARQSARGVAAWVLIPISFSLRG